MQRRVANGAIRWIEVPIYGGSRPHHVSYKGEEMNKEESDRNAAIVYVLRVLKNPMMIMSPAKKEALTLAEEHGIMVKELIETWADLAMRV